MTRKDYVAMARALADTRPSHYRDGDYTDEVANQWRRDRNRLAAVLAADNPRFDRTRFNAATLEDIV